MFLHRKLQILLMLTTWILAMNAQKKLAVSPWNSLCLTWKEAKKLSKERALWWPWMAGGTSAAAATAWLLSRKDGVEAKPCMLNLKGALVLADSGAANGVIEVEGDEIKNLTFRWSNGSVGRKLTGVTAGD
ncbi:MAG: hypothetical protein IPN29_06375 [Saprospiraceae bacterium]|nr:hypothetical protein [Saprospiraceae bacterium]